MSIYAKNNNSSGVAVDLNVGGNPTSTNLTANNLTTYGNTYVYSILNLKIRVYMNSSDHQ